MDLAATTPAGALLAEVRDQLLRRNAVAEEFFAREARRLAKASQEMARRFLAGGRLFAFGDGAAGTDAQHVAVEFVHPVIVGKRALPAVDLGADYQRRLPVLIRPEDIVMGLAFPGENRKIDASLEQARNSGALTFGLSSSSAELAFNAPDSDPHICQEIYEILYHLLWETVHVYFEHREQGHEIGASSFLYPFLGTRQQPLEQIVEHVEQSMLQKVSEVNAIRSQLAAQGSSALVRLAADMAGRIRRGGRVIIFGNGGSATDANDLAIDLMAPGRLFGSIPALSLSLDGATLTAIANDVGVEEIFSRQLLAQAQPDDIAIGISTSGSSPNILACLLAARKQGLLTVGMAGYDGGRIVTEALVDHVIVVSSDYIPRIQEVQASAYHVLLACLRECLSVDTDHA